MSRGRYKHQTQLPRRSTLGRCKHWGNKDPVVVIDIEKDKTEIVVIDDSEIPYQWSRRSKKSKGKSVTDGVITIDDEDDAQGTTRKAHGDGASKMFKASSSFPATDEIDSDVDPILVRKGKHSSRQHEKLYNCDSRNHFGFSPNSDSSSYESDNSESDISENESSGCEIIDDSSGHIREQWERAASKRRMQWKDQENPEDVASATESSVDPGYPQQCANQSNPGSVNSVEEMTNNFNDTHVSSSPRESVVQRNPSSRSTSFANNEDTSTLPKESRSSNIPIHEADSEEDVTSVSEHWRQPTSGVPSPQTEGFKYDHQAPAYDSGHGEQPTDAVPVGSVWEDEKKPMDGVHSSHMETGNYGHGTPSSDSFVLDMDLTYDIHATDKGAAFQDGTNQFPETSPSASAGERTGLKENDRSYPVHASTFQVNDADIFAKTSVSTATASSKQNDRPCGVAASKVGYQPTDVNDNFCQNKEQHNSSQSQHNICATVADASSKGNDSVSEELSANGCQRHPENRTIKNGEVAVLNAQNDLISGREKHKDTDEYRRAMEEEWASRQRELQLQAEEARRLKKRKKAESLRLLEMERRQKQRIEEIRETQKKDEETINLKERLQIEVRKELDQIEAKYRDLASVLRALGISVGGGVFPLTHEINSAYKQALVRFHPDRAPRTDIRQQVEAEEKFKLISRLKEKLLPLA